MNRTLPYLVAAALAAGGVSFAQANTVAPKITSAGSKGDFTAAQEGKSTTPVPPVPVAKAGKATGADARLADKVVAALNGVPSLKGSKIDVMASNGSVTLSGITMSQGQSQKAERLAIAKAKSVTNNLQAAG
jgi:BON domain